MPAFQELVRRDALEIKNRDDFVDSVRILDDISSYFKRLHPWPFPVSPEDKMAVICDMMLDLGLWGVGEDKGLMSSPERKAYMAKVAAAETGTSNDPVAESHRGHAGPAPPRLGQRGRQRRARPKFLNDPPSPRK